MTPQPVAVSAAEDDDALDEAEVVLSHAVSGGDYSGETAGDVTVTVRENDVPTLAIADAQGFGGCRRLAFRGEPEHGEQQGGHGGLYD